MSPIDQLIPILKILRLSGILETLDLRRDEAASQDLDVIEFMYRVLHDEVQRRNSRRLATRLRAAHFEQDKTIPSFEFQFNTKIPKTKIIELAACHYLAKHENVLLLGPAGVGKSHIAQALGHRACEAGHRVVFERADRLMASLRASRADQSYERTLAGYVNADVLIIDDLGLRPLKGDEPGDLYEIVTQRYEKRSTVITSNRALDEWPPIFGDELLASAALDRLLHHAHVLTLEGPSFRTSQRKQS